MRLYVSSPGGSPTNLPRHLQRVARLYRAGALNDHSTVWINARLLQPVFWALTWRSTCFWWHDATTSGTVRLTGDRIRWAPTYNATNKSPEVDVRLESLALDSMKHVTFVVDHGDAPEPVQAVERSLSQPLQDGFFQHSYAAVMDLARYQGPALEDAPEPPRFASSLADVHGAKLLSAGMSQDESADFEERIESYGFDLDAPTLEVLASALASFEFVSDSVMSHITSKATPA